MDILTKLQGIFRDILDDESLVLARETSPGNIDEWDSFAHINIIAACESEFAIKFDINDFEKIKTVGDLLNMIEGKL